MAESDRCELLPGPEELEKAIRTHDRLFVMFYASWCGFSRRFLPVFVDQAEKGAPCYRRILDDRDDPALAKYKIEVYPTVLYFEGGKVAKRLDGKYLRGLDKPGLDRFVDECGGG